FLRERRFDEGTRVEKAQGGVAMKQGARRFRIRYDDSTREPSELRRIPARIELDALDESRMNDRGAEADVIEKRNANAVQEVSDVAGRGSSDEEVRNAARHRRHAGKNFDGSKGVAERAWKLLDFRLRHRAGRGRRRFLSSNRDFDRRILRRRLASE